MPYLGILVLLQGLSCKGFQSYINAFVSFGTTVLTKQETFLQTAVKYLLFSTCICCSWWQHRVTAKMLNSDNVQVSWEHRHISACVCSYCWNAGYFELSKVPVALRFIPVITTIIMINNNKATKFVPIISLSFTKKLFCQHHMTRTFLVLRKTLRCKRHNACLQRADRLNEEQRHCNEKQQKKKKEELKWLWF